jgi:lysophospholipase L1-like esterase
MRSVLCYGDSNTYGQTTADTPDERYGATERWPGVMRALLAPRWLVIEEGLSGRTTVSDDPIEGAEKNGRTYLKPCVQSHKPLDLVILMLGTNDLKVRFNKTASEIAMGIGALAQDIKALRPGVGQRVPEIMIVSPPPILQDLRGWESVFEGGWAKSLRLAEEYARVADMVEVHFFDAGSVAESSPVDGFHLDLEGHRALAHGIAEAVEAIGWPDE